MIIHLTRQAIVFKFDSFEDSGVRLAGEEVFELSWEVIRGLNLIEAAE